MSRLLRLLLVGGATGLVILLGGCGGSRKTGVRVAPSDATIARDVLSAQVTALHHRLHGTWQTIGPATRDLRCAGAASRAQPTGLAISPVFGYERRFAVRVATAVYRDVAVAQQALQREAASPTRACLAAFALAHLKAEGYRTGAASSSSRDLPGTGQAAEAVQATVPVTYQGHPSKWHFESITVREGRLLQLVSTSAGRPIPAFDQRLASALGGLAADVERYLLTGKLGPDLRAPV